MNSKLPSILLSFVGKSLAIFLLVSLVSVPNVFSTEIEINANFLEYDEETKYVVSRESVTVTWENKILRAEKIEFWIEKKYLAAEGNVSLNDGESLLFGDKINYDYNAETATITNVSGFFEPFYFKSDKISKISKKKYKSGSTEITTCNLKKPHYRIRAKKAKITLDKRIVVYFPVFYLGKIPVFCLPILTQRLGKHRSRLEIKPGYNSNDGLIIKAVYSLPLSEYSYGKLYLDYFSRRGWGKGGELNYYAPDRFKGTLYGYHIKEETTENERWNIKASHWQKLNSLWTTQSEVDFISDTSFNNSYFQESWKRDNQQIHSNLSVTRQSSQSNLRIITERYDNYNQLTNMFEAASITIPRITYTVFPFRTRLPFYTNLNLSMQNQYNSSNDYYLLSGAADMSITRDYRLSRIMTLTPRIGIIESWLDRTSKINFEDILVMRYYSNLNLRYRITRSIDWDIVHNYKLRAKTNSFLIDEQSSDMGEEINLMSFRNSMYVGRRITVRNYTSYNFHRNRNEYVDDWKEKFNPLVNEISWIPGHSYYIFFREENDVYPVALRSIQSDMMFGRIEGRYLNLGVFYQSSLPGKVNFNAGVGFWPTSKLRIDYRARTVIDNNLGEIRADDHEFKLYRDLHCWEFKLTYRLRQAAEEIYFQIDLKSSLRNKEKLFPGKQEQEFYPWR